MMLPVIRALNDYLMMSPTQRAAYKVPRRLLTGDVVPYTYLRRRVSNVKVFKESVGRHQHLDTVLDRMERLGYLKSVDPAQFGLRARVYVALPQVPRAWTPEFGN